MTDKTVAPRLPPDMSKTLTALAELREMPESTLIRQILTEYFEAHSEEVCVALEIADMRQKMILDCRAKLKGD